MERAIEAGADGPLVLLVPGLGNSGPGHWQSRWEERRGDCQRVDLGLWDRPHRNTWVNKLNLAIAQAGRPVILVAHSLGCLAVAWWARLEQPGHPDARHRARVRGALLVAPPEVDRTPLDPRLAGFAPAPCQPLPFPSILVASRNDPYMAFADAARLAGMWRSTLVDAGTCGHINAESGLDDWAFGQDLLAGLLAPVAGGPLRKNATGARPGRRLRQSRAGGGRLQGFTLSRQTT